ncbi:MAG: hypothetical protein JSW15_12230 [Deltaproteobacteria bacterium]|nr:MAG: hypothetical protein JSW15_12230 [Deltaproteobacteria bacterium]
MRPFIRERGVNFPKLSSQFEKLRGVGQPEAGKPPVLRNKIKRFKMGTVKGEVTKLDNGKKGHVPLREFR